MGKKDPRVDAYIKGAADFARPILMEVRRRIHESCPDIEETIKWRMPSFLYKGILCGMAAFKQHCAFGFWHTKMHDPQEEPENRAMGQFGRITSLADLPGKKEFAALVKRAVELQDSGVRSRAPRIPADQRPPLEIPAELACALKRNKKAASTFDHFSYSHRKEYIQWIAEAKRDETREKRVLQAMEMLADGKSRNWKYENC